MTGASAPYRGSRKNAGLQIIDQHFGRHAAEEFECASMAIEPCEQLHVGRATDEERARPCHDDDEGVQLSLHAADCDDAHVGPVHLKLLARLDVEARFRRNGRTRPLRSNVVFYDGPAAAVAASLQFVEDPLAGPSRRYLVA